MRAVVAGHAGRTDRLDDLLAVARELEDRVRPVVHEPEMPLGIVRADQHAVRADEQLVVLFPRLHQPAVPIDDVDDVVPPGVIRRVLRGQRIPRRVARRNQFARLLQLLETPAGKDDDAIRTLGPDACRGADDVAGTAPILRPARHQIVGTRDITPALLRRLGEGADHEQNHECRDSGGQSFHNSSASSASGDCSPNPGPTGPY